MIISRLNGGLGNQMFQYAFGRKVSLLNNTNLLLDINEFSLDSSRQFLLSEFNISANPATLYDIFRLNKLEAIYYSFSHKRLCPYFLKQRLTQKRSLNHDKFLNCHERNLTPHHNIVAQVKAEFDEDYLKIPDNVILSGYWLSYKYFLDIADILKKEFTLKKFTHRVALFKDFCLSKKVVGIHIRKTDKVNSLYYYDFTPSFFLKAINFFRERYENIFFVFFSDDIVWVKEHFDIDNAIFIDDCDINKPVDDLIMLSFCQHYFVPCSSFSWWAAWLGETKQSCILIPPSKFWCKRPDEDFSTLSPPHWVELAPSDGDFY